MIMTTLAMPRHPIQTELLKVTLSDAPVPRRAWMERIDEDHANPRQIWRAMGEPEYLSPLEVKQLEAASTLRPEAQPWCEDAEGVHLAIALPPQSVAAITIEFSTDVGRQP